jgi:exonuclease VII small subunit
MSKQNDLTKKSFAEIIEEFELIKAKFDSIELDIEEAVKLHDNASKLLDELEARLKKAQESIKKE